MLRRINYLGSNTLRGRSFASPGLDQAASANAESFRETVLIPVGDAGRNFQVWRDSGGNPQQEVELKNVASDHTDTSAQNVSRKVSLGTIPDFSYQGKGYRLDGVVFGKVEKKLSRQP